MAIDVNIPIQGNLEVAVYICNINSRKLVEILVKLMKMDHYIISSARHIANTTLNVIWSLACHR